MRNKKFKDDIVYSTEKNVVEEIPDDNIASIPNEQQRVLMRIEKKGRKGKSVTIVSGFIGPKEDFESLARTLKTHCGVGGTVKNGMIEIQGDFRNKIREKLQSIGITVKN